MGIDIKIESNLKLYKAGGDSFPGGRERERFNVRD